MNPTERERLEAELGISINELKQLRQANPEEAARLLRQVQSRLLVEIEESKQRSNAIEQETKQLKKERDRLEKSLAKEARQREAQLRNYLTAAIQDALRSQWENEKKDLSEETLAALVAENWPEYANADSLAAFIEAQKTLPEQTKKSIREVMPECTLAEWSEQDGNEITLIHLFESTDTRTLELVERLEGYLKKRDWWWLETVPIRAPANENETLEPGEVRYVCDYTGAVESWIKRLTKFWLGKVVNKTQERVNRGTRQLALNDVARIEDASYARAPRLLSPISFAMGIGCKVASGEEFGIAPGITALIPRGGVIGNRHQAPKPRNHNMILPLFTEEIDSLPVFLAGANKEALSLEASKIATYLLMDTMQGEPEKIRAARFEDLCKLCYPESRIQKTHKESVKKALQQLDSLAVYWPDKGWRKDRIFDVQPFYATPQNDTRTHLGLNASFCKGTLSELKDGDPLLKMIRGNFVVNLKIMALKRSGQFRQVLRASAMFNDYYNRDTKEPRPEAIRAYHPEQWAILCNYLPDPDAPRETDNARSKAKSDALKEMIKDLRDLEQEGFLIIKELTKDGILLHPTEAHLEAREKLKSLS